MSRLIGGQREALALQRGDQLEPGQVRAAVLRHPAADRGREQQPLRLVGADVPRRHADRVGQLGDGHAFGHTFRSPMASVRVRPYRCSWPASYDARMVEVPAIAGRAGPRLPRRRRGGGGCRRRGTRRRWCCCATRPAARRSTCCAAPARWRSPPGCTCSPAARSTRATARPTPRGPGRRAPRWARLARLRRAAGAGPGLRGGPGDVRGVGGAAGRAGRRQRGRRHDRRRPGRRDRLALLDRVASMAEVLARRGLVLRSDLLRPWAHWITPEFEPQAVRHPVLRRGGARPASGRAT